MLKKLSPIVIFVLFSLLIIGSVVFYGPSWGLMDDHHMLKSAQDVWLRGDALENLGRVIVSDLKWGMFRPVFYTWAMTVYRVFADAPLMIYLGIAIFNLATLLLWGFIFNKIWLNQKKNSLSDIFLYPLTFFIFTPYWNNFMYISMQQKFVLFFSALAVYFFYQGYVKERKTYFVLSVSAILLSTLSHGEGIFLNLTMLFLSLGLFFITKKAQLLFSFFLNLVLATAYLFFTIFVQFKGTYTAKYANSFNINKFVVNFSSASLLLRMLTLLAIFYLCFLIIRIATRRNRFTPIFLIFPLGFICYIAILTPWGFPSYHLSVLTPFIMGMFFPLYSFLNSKSYILKILTDSFIFVLALLTLFYIWIPRISKISDIKKMEQFIVDFEADKKANVYFMSQPCMEACKTLSAITKTEIIYLEDSLLSQDKLREPAGNFMIFRDECPSVNLKDVREMEEIYKNNTWRVFSVKKERGISKEFKVGFPENFVEKVKTFLKR